MIIRGPETGIHLETGIPLGLEEVATYEEREIVVETPVPDTPVPDNGSPEESSPSSGAPVTFTARITVYSCVGDTTGAYCPGDTTASGAPLATGIAACGPSWPFGTVFRFVDTGQTVVCADRGGMVSDAHLDVFCERAWERDLCIPGIGQYAEVEIVN